MSIVPALLILGLAIAVGRGLLILGAAPAMAGRFVAIDGLRGYLALAVFLHHGAVWYFYLHTGRWAVPPSRLYTHFGETAVALFFMITAFLFTHKLIEARGKQVDWLRLLVGRVMRLAPLYWVVCLLMFGVVAVLSRGEFGEPAGALLCHAADWLAFTARGAPDVNGVPQTTLIVAGVTWSLRYEWLFYLLLPALGLLLGVRWRAAALPPLVLAGAALWVMDVRAERLVLFAGGIFAAAVCRSAGFRRWAITPPATGVCIAALLTTVVAFPGAYHFPALLPLTLVFCVLAGGNTLGGLLSHPVSRVLGELAYGIYLLHGLALFLLFRGLVGLQTGRSMSPWQHWSVVAAAVPCLLMVCHAAFRWIERPGMQHTGAVVNWLRRSRPAAAQLRRPPG